MSSDGDAIVEPRPIEPERLGPLGEPGGSAGPGTLFPGDTRWFGADEIERRRRIWQALASRMQVVCAPGEQVVYVARGYRGLTSGMYLGLGLLAHRYHQVTLVVTDRRLIEVLHRLDGVKLETCTRGFSWSAVRSIRSGITGLVVRGLDGKRTRWKLRSRGDRRIMKILAPRIEQQLLGAGASPSSFPVEYCPACMAEQPSAEGACGACGALVRSARLATKLSVAVPGGGLAYVGHPVLAAVDFAGEAMILVFVALGLATAANGVEIAGLAIVGALFGILTKLESVHVSRLLAARRRPETQERRDKFHTLGRIGAVLSLVAIAGAALGTGRLADRIDHDLDFEAATGWSGTRAPSAWQIFPGDPAGRSEWTHEDGFSVAVLAYTRDSVGEPEAFAHAFVREEERSGGTIVDRGSDLPGGFTGLRLVERLTAEDGAPLVLVVYLVVDPNGGDVHQVYAIAEAPFGEDAARLVRSLLTTGRWIDAVEPRG